MGIFFKSRLYGLFDFEVKNLLFVGVLFRY